MQRSRALGQYFTPPEVVDLAFAVLAWLAPDLRSGRLLDPSCGEGAFLAGALRAGFPPARLYGLDADPRLPETWRAAQATALPEAAHLAVTDGLVGGGEELFEVIAGNPPFGGQADPEHDLYLAFEYSWWRLGARKGPALPRELWFLERSLRLLRPGGLLAMVLPEGFFANRRWRAQRGALVTHYQVEAVVGLPRSVFRGSRTAVKTALLFARKSPPPAGHVVRLAELDEEDLPTAAARLPSEWQEGRTLSSARPWE